MKLLNFLFILFLYIPQSALSAEADKPYQYPDVWVRDGARVEGMVISWTKHGKPVPFDAKDVLLNNCGMGKLCGEFFFSGKKIKGKIAFSSERSVMKATLDDGSILKVKSLESFRKPVKPIVGSSSEIEFSDGRKIIRRSVPMPSEINPQSVNQCREWGHGLLPYLEMVSPQGKPLWAKYILINQKEHIPYKDIVRDFLISDSDYPVITPDERVLLISGFMTVRLNLETGEMQQAYPDVRIIDAAELNELFIHKLKSNDINKESNMGSVEYRYAPNAKWSVNDEQCTEKFDQMLHQKYFKEE